MWWLLYHTNLVIHKVSLVYSRKDAYMLSPVSLLTCELPVSIVISIRQSICHKHSNSGCSTLLSSSLIPGLVSCPDSTYSQSCIPWHFPSIAIHIKLLLSHDCNSIPDWISYVQWLQCLWIACFSSMFSHVVAIDRYVASYRYENLI